MNGTARRVWGKHMFVVYIRSKKQKFNLNLLIETLIARASCRINRNLVFNYRQKPLPAQGEWELLLQMGTLTCKHLAEDKQELFLTVLAVDRTLILQGVFLLWWSHMVH